MRQVTTLGALSDVPHVVELDGTRILLLRDGNEVRAFSATCPHAGAPLEQGAVCDGRLVCPWHKAMFDIRDGALLEPPALQPLRRYPVRIEGDAVLVSSSPLAAAPAAPLAAKPDPRVMVVVGAGAAGAAGAAALREFGFNGRLVVVGDEPDEPFDRTALSKFVLEGGMKPEEAAPLWPEGFVERERIERLHDTVTAIDPDTRTLTLAAAGPFSYHAVLLAPGSVPRPLDVPGGNNPNVHLLRTRADASAILAGLTGRPRVVVVGGSFIGLEAASALRQQDIPVTVVSPQAVPFEPVLGWRIAAMLRRLHEANGVVFRGRARVATDAGMRVADGIYAAGDSARFPFGDGRIRVEHWRVAQQHARVAARNMLGGDARFEQPPFFWTYHYGKRIEVHGHPACFDRVEIDGDLDAQDFTARLLRNDVMVGLVGCSRDTELAGLALRVPAHP